MRTIRLFAVLVLAAGASFAEDVPARALRGKWKLDKALFAEGLPGYAEATPDEQKQLKDKLVERMPDASVEFGDKEVSFAFAPNPPERAGYRVVASTGNRLELEITSKDAQGRPKPDKTIVELVSHDVLRLTREGMPFAMVLRRVK